MPGLKSFLNGAAPLLGMTPAALYERQRALVHLGALETQPGRGPGSGVPLSANNVAAVVISVLAADSLSEIDARVVALCNALPEAPYAVRANWEKHGNGPTFRAAVARVLRGERSNAAALRISRCWRGQIMLGKIHLRPEEYLVGEYSYDKISITAELEYDMFRQLVTFTRGALSQIADAEEKEE